MAKKANRMLKEILEEELWNKKKSLDTIFSNLGDLNLNEKNRDYFKQIMRNLTESAQFIELSDLYNKLFPNQKFSYLLKKVKKSYEDAIGKYTEAFYRSTRSKK